MENTNYNILIPARGKSTRIPNKNIVDLNGKPLIAYTIEECLTITSNVYVSTESEDIENVAIKYGANVACRPLELAGPFSKVEDSVAHFLEYKTYSDVLVLVQPTSPLVKAKYILEGLEKIVNYDSVISVVKEAGFFWDQGSGKPINFVPGERGRSQENANWLRENGAFYVIRSWGFLVDRILQRGKVGFVEMKKSESVEIDNQDDLNVVRGVLNELSKQSKT
tara:strand:+ start:1574 stop:2242 length:669 start_codon:yes stop_codon:yes gene_type:complete